MKRPIKLYLETETIKSLEAKAQILGLSGRGWLSQYLKVIAQKDIAYLDDNLLKVLKALNLVVTK